MFTPAAGAMLALAMVATVVPSAVADGNAGRLQGTSRYETAVEIAGAQFADGAPVVYLARGQEPIVDALAGGVLDDGPILLVPGCDDVPYPVTREISRLDPAKVIALGGTGAICDDVLDEAADGRRTDRLSGSSRYGTSVAISRAQFPNGADTAYLARGVEPLVDGLAAGALTDGPILLVPPCGDVPAEVNAEIRRLDPERVVALGGTGAICGGMLTAASQGRNTARISGSSRYETAAAISKAQFDGPVQSVYLARAVAPLVDALAGGSLTDGPALLVPPCGELPAAVASEIRRLQPFDIVALGGTGAICDGLLDAAARLGTQRPTYLTDLGRVDSSGNWSSGIGYIDGRAYTRSVYGNRINSSAPASFAEYNLGRSYSRFAAVIGASDIGAENAEFQVDIIGDGTTLASERVSLGDPVTIDLDVSGVLRLRIEAIDLANIYRDDWLVLGNARLFDNETRDDGPSQVSPDRGPSPQWLVDQRRVDSSAVWDTGPVEVNGVTYARSLYAERISESDPASFAAWNLGRDYTRLTGIIGVADSTAEADARFHVDIVGDGQTLWSGQTSLGNPETLDVDVSGVLRLRVEVIDLAGIYRREWFVIGDGQLSR